MQKLLIKLQALNMPEQWAQLNGYIQITADNVIKLICPNPEFGQNVMTSLPMMVAEELDADWKNVVVEMGPHDNAKLGPQFTGGSNSVRMYWKPLREAGAAARQMLTGSRRPNMECTSRRSDDQSGRTVARERQIGQVWRNGQ